MDKKKRIRKNNGSIMIETALGIPVFLMTIFAFFELSRALYVHSTLGIAAQKVASKISVNAKRTSTYNVSGFRQYADQVRFPGAVTNSDQFSFDVVNAQGGGTVINGQADGAASTKVIVTVSFPSATDSTYKIPVFDPGGIIGRPIFGADGLMLSSSATCFLERSRRPTIN